jgi:tRNA threonylcarbamoyl adenosine modification protein (Sua5/YciO/YrdC/YwlC family)
MKSIFYVVNPEHPQPRKIRQLAEILDEGGVIAYPTDTVYGFGCDLTNRKAIERIYRLKRLDPKHLLSFVCPDLSQIARYAHVSDVAYRVLRRILPGSYTIILEATREVPKKLLQKRKEVGIRVPDCPIALDLARELGRPILSSSVEDGDGQPMNDPVDIRERYDKQLDAVVDGGYLLAEPSTVLRMVEDEIEVIREGRGSLDDL